MRLRTLAQAGLERYEISNYARPGHESRHNVNYWEGGDYLGIGAGAHSHHRRPDTRWESAGRTSTYRASTCAAPAKPWGIHTNR